MTFKYPLFAYLIPVVALILIVGVVLSIKRYRALVALFAHQVNAGKGIFRICKLVLVALSIILALTALARPQWGHQLTEIKTEGLDVIFALDVSQSMLAEDVKPSRLSRAKLTILDFIQTLNGDRVGLIAFAADAFLQCPPTLDYEAFKLTLNGLNTESINSQGTNIASAINEARKILKQYQSAKFLIIITDGEDLHSKGLRAAIDAQKQDITIYTMGVGTEKGDIIPMRNQEGAISYLRDSRGSIVTSRLKPETLKAIAEETGGVYQELNQSSHGLDVIYKDINEKSPKTENKAAFKKLPIERFQWPLSLALVLLFLVPVIKPRRPGRFAPLFFVSLFFLSTPKLQASEHKAYDAYQDGDYQQAAFLYQERLESQPKPKLYYNLGNSLYKDEKYTDAISAFNSALKTEEIDLQSQAFYNLANTLYRLGELQEDKSPEKKENWERAVSQLKNVLDLDPNHQKAKENLEFIEEKIRELEENIQDNQDNQEKEENQDSQGEGKDNQDSKPEDNSSGQNQDESGDQGQEGQGEDRDTMDDERTNNSEHSSGRNKDQAKDSLSLDDAEKILQSIEQGGSQFMLSPNTQDKMYVSPDSGENW